MIVLRFILDAIGGSIAGAVIGFGAALVAMSVDGSSRNDGTFGMREVVQPSSPARILSLDDGFALC